ncbi:MAG: RNA chaperone Hfq [Aeromonadaceae bacterium]
MTTEQQNFSTLEQAFSLGNGQDSALNWLRKNRSQVAIFLVSGIKLEGSISGFDQYSVLLTDAHGNQQMIYKAKISTIAMLGSRPGGSFQRPRRPPRPGMERTGGYEDRRNAPPADDTQE